MDKIYKRRYSQNIDFELPFDVYKAAWQCFTSLDASWIEHSDDKRGKIQQSDKTLAQHKSKVIMVGQDDGDAVLPNDETLLEVEERERLACAPALAGILVHDYTLPWAMNADRSLAVIAPATRIIDHDGVKWKGQPSAQPIPKRQKPVLSTAVVSDEDDVPSPSLNTRESSPTEMLEEVEDSREAWREKIRQTQNDTGQRRTADGGCRGVGKGIGSRTAEGS